jgi:hypothetical protein
MLGKTRLADVKDMADPLLLLYLPQHLVHNFASVCWFSMGCSPGHETHTACEKKYRPTALSAVLHPWKVKQLARCNYVWHNEWG